MKIVHILFTFVEDSRIIVCQPYKFEWNKDY